MNEVPRITENGKIGPRDSSQVPRYAGSATYALLPTAEEVARQGRSVDIAVMGAPFDTGVSYRSGARFGPSHIRESSRLLRPFNPATQTSPFAQAQVADAGDMTINPFDISAGLDDVQRQAAEATSEGATLVTLGGDHTIVLPLLRHAVRQAGQPVAVLHFDAHLDTWDTYFGAEYTHGTPFRRAWEEGLLDSASLCHVGTRGPLYGPRDLEDDERFGFGVVTSSDVHYMGCAEVVAGLRERVKDAPLYISVDIDVLDPAHAPGTGTPEPGGLTSRELLEIIRGLRGLHIIGADIVEVSPEYDHAQLSGLAAAHVAYDMISLIADRRASGAAG